MQVKTARLGLKMVEIPIDYHPHLGRSKINKTLRGTIGAGTKIVATILRYATPRGFGRAVFEAAATRRDRGRFGPDGVADSLAITGVGPTAPGFARAPIAEYVVGVSGFVLTGCVAA
jgi:hypothetical protein